MPSYCPDRYTAQAFSESTASSYGVSTSLNPTTYGYGGTTRTTAGHPAMDRSQYGNAGYSYPPGYTDPYAQQQQQQYQAAAPQIRNPFAPPAPAAHSSYAGQNANYDPEYELSLIHI